MRAETEKFLKYRTGVKEVRDMVAFYSTDDGFKRNRAFRQRGFAKQTREAEATRRRIGRQKNVFISGGGCTPR